MVYSLFCAGSNSHGQLALAHDDDSHHFARLPTSDPGQRFSQVACGANHTLAIAYSLNGRRRLWAAGSNARGQLGPSRPADSPTLSFVPLEVADLARSAGLQDAQYDIELVAACWETSFVVLRPRGGNGSDVLLSFGANDWGERGCASPSRVEPSVVDLTAAAARSEKGKETEPRIRVLRLEAGPRHVVALCETTSPGTEAVEDHFLGWGASRHGQLGVAPSATSLPKITPIPRRIPLPSPFSATGIVDLAIGRDHTVVLLERSPEHQQSSDAAGARTVLLLGANKHGQLEPTNVTAGSEDAGSTGSAARTRRQSPSQNLLTLSDFEPVLPAASLYDIDAVGCTWNSTFFVVSPRVHDLSAPSTTTAEPAQPLIVAFGLNSHGQLASCSDVLPKATDLTSSGHQCFHSSTRLIRLPPPPPSSTRFKVQLACGSEHVLALVRPAYSVDIDSKDARATYAAVYGWGWNEHGNLGSSGQLGSQDLADVWEPRRLWPRKEGEETGEVVGVWAGNATSWIQVDADS
ncbi:Secretion-regulating guanine nucleotide exchange factor [Rhodotorula toruloides]|nr:Secretion-regulating guanine nucleotide exchange factor [Rhodotorula toruloides]